MCGLSGIVDFSSVVDPNLVMSMVSSLQHRGPDDQHLAVINDHVVFGHDRLAIIDLSDHAKQPMISEDGNYVLVFTGEVYNFLELRKELESAGISFTSRSDTEVVMQAYAYWGNEAFKRFNGMFALAVWDKQKHTVSLARDRFGIKPLYYVLLGERLIFASEIKALLNVPAVQRRLDRQALHEYLWYGNALGENTLFAGMKKLSPGHFIKFTEAGHDTKSYFSITQLKQRDMPVAEATARVRDELEGAVKRHLVSDVPVSIFLSGGIDSSAITAFASRHYGKPISTYAVGFDFVGNQAANELPKARLVAETFKTDHHEMHIKGGDLPVVIEKLVTCHDEPFADAANIPLYLLAKELRGKVKVVLQGDGGDEIFAGYRRYKVLNHYQLWFLLAKFRRLLSLGMRKGIKRDRYQRFLQAVGQSDASMRMALLLTQTGLSQSPLALLTEDWHNQLELTEPFEEYRRCNKLFSNLDVVQRMLYTDCMIQLPNTFLEKVDKPTMANGLEARVPFLDSQLTEFAMSLSSQYKVRRNHKKWILKQALRGIVPDEILDAPKQGFNVPYEQWLRTSLADYMQSVLLDPALLSRQFFSADTLRRYIREHIQGEKNHGFILWKALNLALWMNKYKVDF